MDAHDAVERLWPGEQVHVEPLGGGITNHNFKVAVGGETYVLRIGGKNTDLLGIDRVAEHAATAMAADLGVGPEVIAFVELEGWLVTRFIDGDPVPEDRTPVALVGATLRRIHSGHAVPGRFDSFRVVESYRDTAERFGVRVPDAYAEAKRRADAVEERRGDAELRSCHNDLLAANFIAQGDRIRIVDWEYAGMGDPFFDLANYAVNHGLSEAAERELLKSYFGEARERDLAVLHDMRFMSDFREAMWGVVQQGISELDFDFAGYADEHFARALA
jgi:thiamine kinase-like enzyme